MSPAEPTIDHYFVDEAGDDTLFDKHGKLLIGQNGVSRTFMVGSAFIPDPAGAHRALEALRANILTDPYFAGVPSLDPARGKTAVIFHAKDDLPEVRREVFRLIAQLGVRVDVAIRRKFELAAEARVLLQEKGRKLKLHSIYDELVGKVHDRTHAEGNSTRIVFARRGKARRDGAFRNAIDAAQDAMTKDTPLEGWAREVTAGRWDYSIESAYPSQFAGLQIVDYYLWAVQRLYEKSEDRFFRSVANNFRSIQDLDDKRQHPQGEFYCSSNPLTIEKMMPLAG